MNEADFRKPTTPGRLEPTTFKERLPGGVGMPKPVTGLAYVPEPLPAGLTKSDMIDGVSDLLMEAERTLGTLNGLARRIHNPQLLIGPFARKEAKHSSAIENTFASDEQLALFNVDESTIETSERPDVQDVSNYLAALRYGWDDKRPICLNLIKQMHSILLTNSERMEGTPGEFRTTQNAIGNRAAPFKDAKFVPPPPRFLAECLDKLEKYIHADDDMPALVRVALVHYQFECIHPFDDGNGRIGRLLVSLQLGKQCGLSLPLVYVSGFFDKYREVYYDHLYRVSSDGAWKEWVNFFLLAVISQAFDAQERAELLDDLRTKYTEQITHKRASGVLPKIIDKLFLNPAITIATAQRICGVSQPTAGKLINRLVELGILQEHTGRKHYRVFVANEIISVMTKHLGAPPTAATAAIPTVNSVPSGPGQPESQSQPAASSTASPP